MSRWDRVQRGNVAVKRHRSRGRQHSSFFVPSSSFTSEQVAGMIIKAMKRPSRCAIPVRSRAGRQFDCLVIDGVSTIGGLVSQTMPPILDLAGNALQANRSNGATQFTIAMPDAKCDFGDAVGSVVPTLLSNNGARHVAYPIDIRYFVSVRPLITKATASPARLPMAMISMDPTMRTACASSDSLMPIRHP